MENTALVLDIKSKSKSKNGYLKFIDIITNLRSRGDMNLNEFEIFTDSPNRILAYRSADKGRILFNQNVRVAADKSFAAGSIYIYHNFDYFEGVSNGGKIQDMPLSLSLYIQRYGKNDRPKKNITLRKTVVEDKKRDDFKKLNNIEKSIYNIDLTRYRLGKCDFDEIENLFR